MLFSEARKRDVVSTATATKIGRVDGFVIDVAPPRVVLLRVGKAPHGSLVSWSDLQGFGPDAATVADEAVIRSPDGPFERHADARKLEVLGKRVLSERGDALTEITDVDFDPETGAITTLLTRSEAIPGERLIGLGSYAVIVSAG